MNRLNTFFSAIWAFIKKYKIVFIVALVVLLFVFGLIRDNTKRKKTNSNNNSVNQIVSGEDKVVKISGGVNKDYYGYIKEDKYLFEIIIEYCNGLNDYAYIDNLELDEIIASTTDIIIQEDELSEVKWFTMEQLIHMVDTKELNDDQISCFVKVCDYLDKHN